jgi:hypothetical protein
LEQLVSGSYGEGRFMRVEDWANRNVFIEGVPKRCEPILGCEVGRWCTMSGVKHCI